MWVGAFSSALIAFECRATDHALADGNADQLTVYDGKWAYCPRDVRASGHVWQAIASASIDELRQRIRLEAGRGLLRPSGRVTAAAAASADTVSPARPARSVPPEGPASPGGRRVLRGPCARGPGRALG